MFLYINKVIHTWHVAHIIYCICRYDKYSLSTSPSPAIYLQSFCQLQTKSFCFLFSFWCYHQEGVSSETFLFCTPKKVPLFFPHNCLPESELFGKCRGLPGAPGSNPTPITTFLPIVFAQLGELGFSLPWHHPQAPPALLAPPPGEVWAERDVLSGRMLPRRLSHPYIT